jgi:hypothetical protein
MAEPNDTSTHDAFKENINMAAAPPKPTQRLIIKKMVLENFKSYAGTVEIGPFHKVCSTSDFQQASPCFLSCWSFPGGDKWSDRGHGARTVLLVSCWA